jgi:hypothetical protein
MATVCSRLVLILACSAAAVAADAAHITDKLLAGLYAEPQLAEQPVQLLPSGTPVEVLASREGFRRVRLGDGTEGWVEARYLSEEKPARAMLLEAQARLARLEAELAGAGTGAGPEPAAPAAADCTAAEQALTALQQRVATAGALLAGEAPPPAGAPAKAAASRPEARWSWIGLGAGLALGFVGGALFVDYRQRRRHGGFRI